VGVAGSAAVLFAALGAPFPARTPSDDGPPRVVLASSSTNDGDPSGSAERDTKPRSATLVMGGDLLWHDTVWLSAAEDHRRTGHGARFDFDPMFKALRPLVSGADIAVCHEEVPFAARGAPLQSYPVFAAPPEVARWVARMGFDACTTASNHSLDQGYDGIVRTANLLDAAGVAHVGTFRSRAERREPVILTTDQGVRVGIVAGTYGLNGFALPEGREYSVSMWDPANLLAQARAARRAGADIVVVHLHGGTEYDHLPNADQVAVVDRLARSPYVDLVLGEHAHVVQPITKVAGTWVVYGMGNLVAQQEVTRPDTYQGIVVRFRFVERAGGGFRVARASYVPIAWNHYSSGSPIRIRRLDRGGDPDVRAAIADAVDGLGHEPGLTGG
jgi:poly-gamma-glutamate capsule biosynthesis protein CapA/YwtB (metallophosphatase superfamily)